MSYYRTPEHRRLQSEAIQRWKPWERSTGPKTAEGKAKASRNGCKGATRQELRELARALRGQRESQASLGSYEDTKAC